MTSVHKLRSETAAFAELSLDGAPAGRASRDTIGTPAGSLASGFWQCPVTSWESTMTVDETIYVISGSATVTTDDEAVQIAPGDLFLIAAGTRAEWNITAEILVAYVLGPAEPSGTA